MSQLDDSVPKQENDVSDVGGETYAPAPITWKEVLAGVICGLLVGVVASLLFVAVRMKTPVKPATLNLSWMSEIARKVDPVYADKETGFIVLSMSCYDPYQQVRGGVQPIMYAYGKFDVNLKTGQLKGLGDPMMPPVSFTCPKMEMPQITPPATTSPSAPSAPAPAGKK